jgi:hypothetical protein
MVNWRAISADEAWALVVCQNGGFFGDLCSALAERVGEAQAPSQAATIVNQRVSDGLVRE